MNHAYLAVTASLLIGLGVCFLSLVQTSIGGLSRVSLRVLAEKHNGKTTSLLAQLSKDPRHFLLPIELGIQVMQVVGAVLITTLFSRSNLPRPYLLSVATLLVAVYLFRQLLPRLITQHSPDRVLLRILPLMRGLYAFLSWLSFPVFAILQKRQLVEEEEEPSEEEIQAYLDVGEEEGIIEKEESELIQSALEFGDTLAREIMTPRSEIVAIQENASISELKDLFVSSRHSRIPVYRQHLDDIVGVVYVRHLLPLLETAKEEDPITPLLNRPWFVPETKRVAELLKEMQANAEHLAVVINEYGAVAGVVTLEDLVEEIVGEIRDEDELLRLEMSYEGNGSYIVRGGVSLEEIEETMDLDLGDPDVTTISGLVVASLGRVPRPGETIRLSGLEAEVLSADRRRIHTLRIRRAEMSEVSSQGAERPREPSD